MSQFNLDLSYNFKGIRARSQSIRTALEHSRQNNMEFADDFAGDVFNALYQHNPTLGAENNSKYSQAIRAALSSPQFQHLRMQTRDSVHWSATAAALITSTLAQQLNFNNEEQPPEPQGCLPQLIDEETENEGEGEQSEEQGDPQSGEGKGKQSSDEFDESSDDSDDSG